MEKCAALSNLLQNQPDVLDFTVLDCGNVKLAGIDELFTVDEIRHMLDTRFKYPHTTTTMEKLAAEKHAIISVTKEMIPPIEKTAENTGVVVDMYEVDYYPPDIMHSDQEIAKKLDLVNDYVSRMVFPDTTVNDIVVGPKEHVFKKKPTQPKLQPHIPTRTKASIWTKADEDKCPECGSTEFGWMPPDFETAKCSECGKTWQGKNPPLPPTSKKATGVPGGYAEVQKRGKKELHLSSWRKLANVGR